MKMRESKVEKDFKVVNFVVNVNKTSLTDLSLEELTNRYIEIDYQSQMMKGLILLEARNRFPSNNEFGDWIKTVGAICADGKQVRNRLMHYAKFFNDREQDGISLSACYLISAPVNSEVAEVVYKEILGNNLPLENVKQIIQEKKGITINEQPVKSKSITSVDLLRSIVLKDVSDVSIDIAIQVLEDCLTYLRGDSKPSAKMDECVSE